ncbi:MAG: exodeoxyribonuclease V subunit gamma [Acidimicrobiales bacterium]
MTLSIFVSDSLEPLADQLAESLAVPLADPMQSELVAVPSVGLQRWLKLHLASTLGAGSTGDGIAANIDMPFPGILRSRLFSADTDPSDDPWRLSRLVWAVHHVLANASDDPDLRRIRSLPDGATLYGRARRIADLFDRYATRRTEVLRRWERGEDVDPAGHTLPPSLRWQPHLFRLIADHIGTPSPARRLPELLARVRTGDVEVDLPARFSIFGVSTLPGGQDFARLLNAFGERFEVNLFMLDPAIATSSRLLAEIGDDRSLLRADDGSASQIRQPLLRSWGRPSREAQLLLPRVGLPQPSFIPSTHPDPLPRHLLGALQHHLLGDEEPAGDFELRADDASIRIHACAGVTRQVEALRDEIMATLRDDPGLQESDVLVVCPDLPTFAPAIQAVFGPSAEKPAPQWEGPRRLRTTISDRGLEVEDSLGSALSAVVGLVASRYRASELLDVLRLPPIADAFGFDSDALTTIERWLDHTEVRWGLNEANRRRNGLVGVETNTWAYGIRQLLVGMAVKDDEPVLGPNGIPAWGVESSGVDVLNRLVSVFDRLSSIEDEWNRPAPISDWNRRLSDAVGNLFQLPFHDAWQIERTRRAIAESLEDAAISGSDQTNINVVEIHQLLQERLGARAARPRFFDGAITFTSLRPLRWVPHRVICVLGLDEAALTRSVPSGDDLLALRPDLGDPDQRADQRQALLEVILSAHDRLIITRDGHDVRTGSTVYPSVALAELRSEIRSIVTADSRSDLDTLEVEHRRHAFDPENFHPTQPRGFDPRALSAARATFAGVPASGPEPLPLLPDDTVVSLRSIVDTVTNAPRLFYTQRLGAWFPARDDGVDDNLPIATDYLLNWQVLSRLIDLRRRGEPTQIELEVAQARGSYPPGEAGATTARELDLIAGEMVELLRANGSGYGAKPVSIDVECDGVAIVGEVAGVDRQNRNGPIRATASKSDDRLMRGTWIDLCALTLQHPEHDWQAIAASKGSRNKERVALTAIRMLGDSADERFASARLAMTTLLHLRSLAMCEPLPVLAKVRATESRGAVTLHGWRSRGPFPGMLDDPFAQAAFGRITDTALIAIDSRPYDPDPPGGTKPPSRLLAYQQLIDDTFELTAGTESL